MNDGVRDWYMRLAAKEKRDLEMCAAMVAMGSESLCEPAGPDDDRTLTPWLASLAAVGLNPMHRQGVEDNIEHMAPEVRERARHALKLIKVFEARARRKSESLTDAIPVLDFLGAVAPFSDHAQPVNHPSRASKPAVVVPESVARPLQRQQHQEAAILRVLRELGHDPHSLPRNTPGRAGPKAAAFGQLGWKKEERGVFDKAWDRLRQTRDIADA
jgi:hypothetical protein